MLTKIIFYYFRYVNGFLLRIFTFSVLELLKNKNFKFIDEDYQQVNEAAENLAKLNNPYEDSNFRKTPILPFIFIFNLLSQYNFMKIVLIFIEIINSMLIEILLNLQQRKYIIKRKVPEIKKNIEEKNKFYIIQKIYNFLILPKEIKNNDFYNKTPNDVSNKKNLTCISYFNYDLIYSIHNKEKCFEFLLAKENENENTNHFDKPIDSIENKFKDKNTLKRFYEIFLNMIDNKYSIYSIYYLYNPIIILSVAKGNYDPMFFMLIFLILISLELDIYLLAGAIYGISIHFEYFPIIYLPGVILYIFYKSHLKDFYKDNQKENDSLLNNKIIARFSDYLWFKVFLIIKSLITEFLEMLSFIFGTLFSIRSIKFLFSTLFFYLMVFTFFYLIFGEDYLNDIFFYPIFSKSDKPNFSVFHYFSLFLKKAYVKKVFLLSLYLVQVVFIILSNVYLYKDINLCILMTTWIYVIFGKEVSLRNISWIFILLCLNMHTMRNLNEKLKKYLIFFSLYCYILFHWSYNFYSIETFGENKYLSTWIINLFFFILNCIFLNEICSDRTYIIYYIN